MILENVVKKYDKMLCVKRKLDGSKEICRQSPFNTDTQYPVFTIKNENIGSGLWVRKKLMFKDNQRFDIVGSILDDTRRIKNKQSDDRVHREIADFIEKGGESFVT